MTTPTMTPSRARNLPTENHMATRNLTKTAAAHAAHEQMGAGRRSIVIDIVRSHYGSPMPRVQIWWAAGRKVQSEALLAEVYGLIARVCEAAAHQGVKVGLPAFAGIMLDGGDRCRATLTFETITGEQPEADRIDALLHDAIPAPI